MARRFEELDARQTRMGLVTLRRRIDPQLQVEVYEVKLDDEFLMSSLFTVAERELARLGLAEATGERLAVLVGGLGLGYTAITALLDDRVGELVVVDALAEVIDWHRRGLLPDALALGSDERVSLVQGDFFSMMREPAETGSSLAAGEHDVILLDIDHTPRHVLDPSHAAFYGVEGLEQLRGHLRPGGVFAMWSDDPPDADFLAALTQTFTDSRGEVVTFANPLTRGESTATVYVAVC